MSTPVDQAPHSDTTAPALSQSDTPTAQTPRVGEGARLHAELLKHRFFLSLPFGILTLSLSMVPAFQFIGWQWVVALASIPVVTWGAWPFHRAAFAAGRHGSTTMDTLVSLGVIASSLWSWWALLFGGAGRLGMRMSMTLVPRAMADHAEIYFEGATTIVLFLLLGRWMEARTRYRAGDALRSLLELGAKDATLVHTDPLSGTRHEERVPISRLAVGDIFLVRPGEKIATDGVVVAGNSALDTSMLTGESLPTDVGPGEEVTGATVNTWGVLEVRATRVGADTALAHISRMVTEAQAGKAPVQRLADRISSIFVPTVIVIAILTFTGWLLAGAHLQTAFTAGVAVLVVACPCALGLATPTALLVGSGRASRLGIIITSAEVLQQTHTIDTMVCDKTGTVTSGKMELDETIPAPQAAQFGDALAIAAGVESASEHPLARAIVSGAQRQHIHPVAVTEFSNHAGLGVSGLIDLPSGKGLALVGRASWLESHGVDLSDSLRHTLDDAQARGGTAVVAAIVPSWSHSQDAALDGSESESSASLPHSQDAPDTHGVKTIPAPLATVTMNVHGMTCASCVRRVERKLSKLQGVSASVNLATESATVTLTSPHTDLELEEVVNAAGYTGTVLQRTLAPKATPSAPLVNSSDASSAQTLSTGEETRPLATSGRVLPQRILGAIPIAVLVVRDTIKETSPTAIASLARLGIEPILLTGDNEAAARQVAHEVGISRVIAQVLPEEKRQVIAQLQEEGRVVAMVGDGVNDAAALAQASVRGLGIAMGSGTDVAIEVADITLVNSDLMSAVAAIRISRRTLRVIKGNLFWAFAYNVAMIPLAIAGLLNPMIASAAMAFSSVFVVLNSLRLRTAR